MNKLEAEIVYIGDDPYTIFKWQATIYVDGQSYTEESSNWRWWLTVWVHLRGIGIRRELRAKKRDRAKPNKRIQL